MKGEAMTALPGAPRVLGELLSGPCESSVRSGFRYHTARLRCPGNNRSHKDPGNRYVRPPPLELGLRLQAYNYDIAVTCVTQRGHNLTLAGAVRTEKR